MDTYHVVIDGTHYAIQGPRPPSEDEARAAIKQNKASESAIESANDIGSFLQSGITSGLPGLSADAAQRASQVPGELTRSAIDAATTITGLKGANQNPMAFALGGYPGVGLAQGSQLQAGGSNILNQLLGNKNRQEPAYPSNTSLTPQFPQPNTAAGNIVSAGLATAAPIMVEAMGEKLPAFLEGLSQEMKVPPGRFPPPPSNLQKVKTSPNPFLGKTRQEIKSVIEQQKGLWDSKLGELDNLEERVNKAINLDARNITLKYRDPNAYRPGFEREMNRYGNGFNYVTEGVNVPKDDARVILLNTAQKQGLLDKEGVLLRQPRKIENAFMPILKRYGVMGGQEPSQEEMIRSAIGNLDKGMQSLILDRIEKGVMTPESILGSQVQEVPESVPLKSLMEEVKGMGQMRGGTAPTQYDRIRTNFQSSLNDYLAENGQDLGIDKDKMRVLGIINKNYKPFAEFKNEFYNTIDPHNEVGPMDTQAGTKLFERLFKGKHTGDDSEFVKRFAQYIDPDIHQQILTRQSAFNSIPQIRKFLQSEKDKVGQIGNLAEDYLSAKSAKEAKTIGQKIQGILQSGGGYAIRRAFIYNPVRKVMRLIGF